MLAVDVEEEDLDGDDDSFRLFSRSCFLSFSFARRLRAVSAALRGEGEEERGGGFGGGALAADADDTANNIGIGKKEKKTPF